MLHLRWREGMVHEEIRNALGRCCNSSGPLRTFAMLLSIMRANGLDDTYREELYAIMVRDLRQARTIPMPIAALHSAPKSVRDVI